MPINNASMIHAQKNTTGGSYCASIFSGQAAFTSGQLPGAPGAVAIGGGADVLLFSGPGRLDLIFQHQPMQSGLSVLFYDSVVPTSGGPFPLSGHKIIGQIPPTWRVPIGVTVPSGQTNFVDSQPGTVYTISFPFTQGLAVATKSGQPGFSVTYSPEQLTQ